MDVRKVAYTTSSCKTEFNFKKCDFPEEFDIEEFKILKHDVNQILNDKDIIDIGGRTIKVLHTPGHSPGHICLYEEDRKYLYAGDLIYKGTLYAFYPTTDPYKFMKSVERVTKLKIKKVLPGHHKLDISVDLVDEIYKGFRKIYDEGLLKQGNGVFEFKEFSIQI